MYIHTCNGEVEIVVVWIDGLLLFADSKKVMVNMENIPNGKQTQSLAKASLVTPKATRASYTLTLLEKLYTQKPTRTIDLAVDCLALYMGNSSEQHVTVIKEFLH